MSKLEKLKDYVRNAKLGGRKVISTEFVDAMLSHVYTQSLNTTTDTLDGLEKGGEVHESDRCDTRDREGDRKRDLSC